MFNKNQACLYVCLFLSACVQMRGKNENSEAISNKSDIAIAYVEHLPDLDETTDSNNSKNARLKAIELVEDDCLSLDGQQLKLPAFLENPPLIMTGVDKACMTLDGERGYRKNSTWTALSIPCTAGNGRIDVKGSPYAPKQVRFLFHVSCPAVGSAADALKSTKLKKNPNIELGSLALIHPLMVQYWEIVDSEMHGIGQFIALESPHALRETWRNFYLNKHKIRINLYGRENSWNANDLFKITGEIYLSAERKFTFVVEKVESLNSTEISQKKRECIQTNQMRECENIF